MRHRLSPLAVASTLLVTACGRSADPSDDLDAAVVDGGRDDAPSANPEGDARYDGQVPIYFEAATDADGAVPDVAIDRVDDRGPDTTTDVPPLACARTTERALFRVRLPDGTTDDCSWRPPADGSWTPNDVQRSVAGIVRKRPADAGGAVAFALEVLDRDSGAPTTLVLEIDQPVPLTVPEGAFVEVAYEVAWGWACTSFLRITNLPTLNGQKNPVSDVVKTYLLANDGFRAPKSQMASVGVTVETYPLGCMPDAGGACSSTTADSYFFRFSQQGQPSLDVLMGQSLPWRVGEGDVVVKNLQSFETGLCDDYWNWGFVFAAK